MPTPTAPGTIDITDLVEKMRQTFVTWAVGFLFAYIITVPFLTWMAAPVISAIVQRILEILMDILSKSSVMLAFFGNTAIRKASQAKDFTDAAHRKDSLPPTATDAEYEAAEKAEMQAFKILVMVTT